MKRCRSWVHGGPRRQVLGAAAGGGGTAGLGGMLQPVVAEEMARSDKQILLIWLDGGMSQLESWDPKPNTAFGGPFRSIPTTLPGIHVSELMPRLSRQMQRLALVRSMKTEDANHSSGVPKIMRGQPRIRGVT